MELDWTTRVPVGVGGVVEVGMPVAFGRWPFMTTGRKEPPPGVGAAAVTTLVPSRANKLSSPRRPATRKACKAREFLVGPG